MLSRDSIAIIVAVYMVSFMVDWSLSHSVEGRKQDACTRGCNEYYHGSLRYLAECLKKYNLYIFLTTSNALNKIFKLAVLRPRGHLLIDMATCKQYAKRPSECLRCGVTRKPGLFWLLRL
jgi:hypothetical protein